MCRFIGTKVRISERKSKKKKRFSFAFSESTFGIAKGSEKRTRHAEGVLEKQEATRTNKTVNEADSFLTTNETNCTNDNMRLFQEKACAFRLFAKKSVTLQPYCVNAVDRR
jgi:hypothetical protein